MRKRKTIKIDDREITVKELTVREIIEIGDKVAKQEEQAGGSILDLIKEGIGEHITFGLEGITIDDIYEMAPSDIELIYKSFREVNGVFFEVAHQVGLTNIFQAMKEELRNNFLRTLAA